MNIEEVVVHYLKKYPGASAKRIIKYCHHSCMSMPFVKENEFESVVSKKLRVLKKKGIVHNKRNSWYLMKLKA